MAARVVFTRSLRQKAWQSFRRRGKKVKSLILFNYASLIMSHVFHNLFRYIPAHKCMYSLLDERQRIVHCFYMESKGCTLELYEEEFRKKWFLI